MRMDELRCIIDGCRRREDHWQHRLYEVFSPRYYALCLRYCHSPEEAEDILVQGFVKIYTKIDDYRGGDFTCWMFGIFVNTALDHLRHLRRKERELVTDEMPEEGEEEDHAMHIDVSTALGNALQNLPDTERAVFNMYAVDGYTLKEIAEQLQLPLGTIKTIYYRSRQLMQRQMTKTLGDNYLDA